MKDFKKKLGRKPKPKHELENVTITFRVTQDMYEALAKASKRHKKKQSDLLRSFVRDSLIEEKRHAEFYGSDSAKGLALLVGAIANQVEVSAGAWNKSQRSYLQLVSALRAVISHLAPPSKFESEPPENFVPDLSEIDDEEWRKDWEYALRARSDPKIFGIQLGMGFYNQLLGLEQISDADLNNEHVHFSHNYCDFPRIRRLLGLDKEKK